MTTYSDTMCIACDSEPVGPKSHEAGYDYCRSCYYSGRAETHRNAAWLTQIHPDAFVYQSGGGTQNPCLEYRDDSGKYVGETLFAIIFGDSPYDWEIGGGATYAHPAEVTDGEPYFEWCGDYVGECKACSVIDRAEQLLSAQTPDGEYATDDVLVQHMRLVADTQSRLVKLFAGRHTA